MQALSVRVRRRHGRRWFERLGPCFLVGLVAEATASGSHPQDPGAFVRSLWLFQRFAEPEAVRPDRDVQLKGMIARRLRDGVLDAGEVEGLMDPETFERLAGPGGTLDAGEVRSALDADAPATRARLLPKVADHARALTTGFDLIDPPHRVAGARLADWIVANHRPGRALHVTVICTGNSRRSMLGATMGNVAAAYFGMPEVTFHSGGTAPSAFNRRTIAALESIGVEIERTGEEAPRGEPMTPNPIYRVRWGSPGDPALEALEFSKTYHDPANPQDGFAALMVCGEADEGCPFVKGAAVRISMPYLDPKLYDDGAYEDAKYAERRDDIGRMMLCTLMQARNRLLGDTPNSKGK